MVAHLFITGIPGAGKTTLAGRVAKRTGRVLLSAHDLVDLVDPGAIAEGRMADEQAMRQAFVQLMTAYDGVPLVMDGWPRNSGQAQLLPPDSIVVHLRCSRSIAVERLTRRARPDDTPGLIQARLLEQAAIFNGDWIRDLAGWSRTLNTSNRTAASVEETVMLYLDGRKREVF